MIIVFSFNVLTGLREIYTYQFYIRLPHITRCLLAVCCQIAIRLQAVYMGSV